MTGRVTLAGLIWGRDRRSTADKAKGQPLDSGSNPGGSTNYLVLTLTVGVKPGRLFKSRTIFHSL